ncbi:MAG: PAS domain-containing sensor histidine kinase [Gammaproteobacteria bacterium RIFCSPHIGHO2_12_FULL_37_14]|nr:MAG: PAS domain-containing sensor histidine kinase [Gammaproteobacteria bacterium RIFCSPHIGHO2_12_FULL_37_14]
MNDIVLLKHWIERERRARKEAERIGEEKITELFNLNCDLEVSLNLQKRMYAELEHRNREIKIQKVKIEHESYDKSILTNILDSSIAYSIIAADLDGTIIIWNKGAFNNYGYTAEEMVGKKNIKSLHVPEDIQSGRAQKFLNAVNQHAIAEEIFERLRKDGSTFTASVVITLRKNNANHPIGYVIISKDITERKLLEEQLIKSNKELEQFAHIISHDLKSPLRAIANLSSWIMEDCAGKLTEESNKHLYLLNQRVNRMAALIDGVLKYSQAGRINLDLSIVDIKKLLQEIIDTLHPPQTFTIRYGTPFPVFKAEKIPLTQVFTNLIENSIKHHHKNYGIIEVGATERDGFYEFYVKDNGPGIDPEYFDKIFEIFQTLEADTSGNNTGVGLSIVKKIVESQGGSVWVQSKVGEGSTFYFTWAKQVKDNS